MASKTSTESRTESSTDRETSASPSSDDMDTASNTSKTSTESRTESRTEPSTESTTNRETSASTSSDDMDTASNTSTGHRESSSSSESSDSTTTVEEDAELTVLLWNIHGKTSTGMAEIRKMLVREVIQACDCDALLLQEVPSQEIIDCIVEIGQEKGREYVFIRTDPQQGKIIEAVIVFDKLKFVLMKEIIIENKVAQLPMEYSDKESFYKNRSCGVRLRLCRYTSREMVLMSFHNGKDKVKAVGFLKLTGLISEQERVPVIAGADFNMDLTKMQMKARNCKTLLSTCPLENCCKVQKVKLKADIEQCRHLEILINRQVDSEIDVNENNQLEIRLYEHHDFLILELKADGNPEYKKEFPFNAVKKIKIHSCTFTIPEVEELIPTYAASDRRKEKRRIDMFVVRNPDSSLSAVQQKVLPVLPLSDPHSPQASEHPLEKEALQKLTDRARKMAEEGKLRLPENAQPFEAFGDVANHDPIIANIRFKL